MKILGITGGVGAGKSTILSYLRERYGASVILADEVGHRVQEPGQECYEKIVEQFGTEILCEPEQGTASQEQVRRIDRQKLGALVYTDRNALERLNGLVHPAVKTYIIAEIERARRDAQVPFVVVEAALLLEDHYDQICDEIWYIYTDPDMRVRRLMQSRGYSMEKIRNIMQNQMQDAEFRSRCDYVIDNSSDFIENTYEQIDEGLVEHGFL